MIFSSITDKNIKSFDIHKQYEYIDLGIDTTNDIKLVPAIYTEGLFNISDSSDTKNQQLIIGQYYSQIVHNSLYNNYYSEFNSKPALKYQPTNIYEKRILHDKNIVIAVSPNLYGNSLQRNTVSLDINSGSIGTCSDDGYGNLIDDYKYNAIMSGSFSGSVADLNNHIVLYYSFDNTYRDTVNIIDDSIFEHTGIGNNLYSIASEINDYGRKIHFESSSGSCIQCRHNKVFDFVDDFSVSFIYKTPSNFIDSTIISKNGSITQERITKNNKGIPVLTYESKEIFTKYPFQIDTNSSGQLIVSRFDGLNSIAITSSVLLSDTLYHIHIQKNYNELQLYINGIADNSVSDTLNNCNNECDIYIGCLGDKTNFTTCDIDNLKLYSKGFTEDELFYIGNFELNGILDYYIGNVFYEVGLIVFCGVANLGMSEWILAYGYWYDQNIWMDNKKWYDSPAYIGM